ncbi:MAG: ribosomal protein S18-alanine N-acetyltransferase [Longimicrobiales bacterium]|nr:ribosomal protein S18-alanine N-acetyltransferase [Longimicrobiales bacterium]
MTMGTRRTPLAAGASPSGGADGPSGAGSRPSGSGASPLPGERIRRMEARDIARVVELESAAFTSPWHAHTFHRLLDREGSELLVVEIEDKLVGYAVLWCVVDQAELANIAVDPEWQRRGIGSRLLETVLERARARGVIELFLEVRAGNRVARELYHRRGFVPVGVRRDYYDAPREDACVLRLALDDPS